MFGGECPSHSYCIGKSGVSTKRSHVIKYEFKRSLYSIYIERSRSAVIKPVKVAVRHKIRATQDFRHTGYKEAGS